MCWPALLSKKLEYWFRQIRESRILWPSMKYSIILPMMIRGFYLSHRVLTYRDRRSGFWGYNQTLRVFQLELAKIIGVPLSLICPGIYPLGRAMDLCHAGTVWIYYENPGKVEKQVETPSGNKFLPKKSLTASGPTGPAVFQWTFRRFGRINPDLRGEIQHCQRFVLPGHRIVVYTGLLDRLKITVSLLPY